ncbi:MAG: 4-hydroxybenzoyl-CoA reductase [Candidatus Rokuibacteriota bacterium]|nr:MAG: 4-hydroxybenzoyl-CoA reductase [Candidatus Rokubacteria bacterium]PYO04857.1 MAG: 4-hydroxybenzoyl-CoA reductase [Candidatus Rokubacteria bacterium]
MRLHPFGLVEPESLSEALDAVTRLDGEARLVAGGTALVPMIRLGLVKPDRLVSLQRVPVLAEIRKDGPALELGAMATHADIERSRAVRDGWPLLREAVRRVATPAIRTSGTIGGNLAYAEAASDPAPALMCHDAEVRVAGPHGGRTVPISRFFRGFYEAALEPGEIVTAVRVPPPPVGARGGYIKFTSRSAEDKPLVGVAALITLDSSGRCTDIRIALGGAAPTPIRAAAAERTVRGEALTDAVARAAAEAAARDAEPLSDLMGSAEYRREMIRVWVRRLLTALRDGTR